MSQRTQPWHINFSPTDYLARLTGGSDNLSRVCSVGRRFSRDGFLVGAHEGCHGQQSDSHETDFDSWDSIFRIQFMLLWFAPRYWAPVWPN
jgi:hypothetical protein